MIALIAAVTFLANGNGALAAPPGQGAGNGDNGLVNRFPLGHRHLCCRTRTTTVSSPGLTPAPPSPQASTPSNSQPVVGSPTSRGGGSSGLLIVLVVLLAVIVLAALPARMWLKRRGPPAQADAVPADAEAMPAKAKAEAVPAQPEAVPAPVPAPAQAEAVPAQAEAVPAEAAPGEAQAPAAEAEARPEAHDRHEPTHGHNGADPWQTALDLHERGDLEGAAYAYLRAEEAGVTEAAFNLGVMLYEVGDYDGAQAAWARCLDYEHPRAATNLGFLLAQRGDLKHAREAYLAGERWGDPDARRLADMLDDAQ